jgi:glucosylceramidase
MKDRGDTMITASPPAASWRRAAPLIAATALLSGLTSSILAAPGAGAAQPPAPLTARVWLTTPDGAQRMAEQAQILLTTGPRVEPTIVVDPGRRFQTVEGFGASITDSSAAVLYRLTEQNREATMTALFDPEGGNGLSLLRQPMGASDFVVDKAYTYDDLPAGQTDYSMSRFSIDHDKEQILPLVQKARALNPALMVIATPWSPPAWMKTNSSLVGGQLIDDPRIYRAYARYFVKFIQAYAAAGVPVAAVSTQNEPQNRTPSGYPGMFMPAEQQSKLIAVLGPMLRQAGLKTKILAYDHNWSMHPDDIAATPAGEAAETEYPTSVLSGAAAKWVGGVAYHCYYGDSARQSALHMAFPKVPVYFTECSGSASPTDPPAKVFSDTLRWHSRNIIIGATRNWARTVANWNLALDPQNGPHVGGCATCTGVVTVGPDQTVTRNAEFYTLGHLSRFVRPGAVRIASTSFGTTGWNGQVMDVAFRNRDGSTALVVHNENDEPRRFSVTVEGRGFDYTLPGGSLATFTWPASAELNDGLRQLDPAAMTATATPAAPADPCCSGDVAANLVDDDASTRWASGTGQAPGQQLRLDLGRSQRVARVVVDTGASDQDYARGYELYLSADGTQWGDPVATGSGTGQLTTIDVPKVAARYVRVVGTGSVGNWWSVADVRVYAGGGY